MNTRVKILAVFAGLTAIGIVFAIWIASSARPVDRNLGAHHRSGDTLELSVLVDSDVKPLHGVFIRRNYDDFHKEYNPRFDYSVRHGEVRIDQMPQQIPSRFTLYVNDKHGNANSIVVSAKDQQAVLNAFDLQSTSHFFPSDLWDRLVLKHWE